MTKLAALMLLAPVIVLCASCVAAPGVGEFEGLTVAEAAERLGYTPGQLTDCELECIAFATEGCSNICEQCDDGTDVAVAGAYVADCTTAKSLACGNFTRLQMCQSYCNGALH